jgi:hypothetical protein
MKLIKNTMFKNRKLLIATKHQKEQVIAPILERELGVLCYVDSTFDTDELGTFTGEKERLSDPITTVREKCLRAMKLSNCDLAVASEGSFGPHPSMFIVNADDEFLIFIDTLNKIEIIVREVSVSTNFNGGYVKNLKELHDFAKAAQFPAHALILRKSSKDHIDIHKGIHDINDLETSFAHFQTKYQTVYVETDMRAQHNPMRMEVIASAAEKLVQKIKSTCPSCNMPGFGISEVKKGLPCSVCASPTNSILSYVYQCQHCQFSKEEMYPQNKTTSDPTYCDYCNP